MRNKLDLFSFLTNGGFIKISDQFRELHTLVHSILGDENYSIGQLKSEKGIDFRTVATDLLTNTTVCLTPDRYPEMALTTAVEASCAVPFLFTPVNYSGMLLVDGAMKQQVPTLLASDVDDAKKMCVYVEGNSAEPFEKWAKASNAISMRVIWGFMKAVYEAFNGSRDASMEAIESVPIQNFSTQETSAFNTLFDDTNMSCEERHEYHSLKFNHGQRSVQTHSQAGC